MQQPVGSPLRSSNGVKSWTVMLSVLLEQSLHCMGPGLEQAGLVAGKTGLATGKGRTHTLYGCSFLLYS